MPHFPGVTQRLQWNFDDPSSFQGSYEEKLARTRVVWDAIESGILEFLSARKGQDDDH